MFFKRFLFLFAYLRSCAFVWLCFCAFSAFCCFLVLFVPFVSCVLYVLFLREKSFRNKNEKFKTALLTSFIFLLTPRFKAPSPYQARFLRDKFLSFLDI